MDYGNLVDYRTGRTIRPATRDEWQASHSSRNGEVGTFTIDRDGMICAADANEAVFGPTRTVFVVGGPPPKTAIGEPCDVCEGPCRYGHCDVCGGHSEHNWGCEHIGTPPSERGTA